MLICYICKTDICTVKGLFAHFKKTHGITGRFGTFRCAQRQCSRSFNDKYVLSRHFDREHPDDVANRQDTPVEVSTSKSFEESCSSGYADVELASAEEEMGDCPDEDDVDLESLAAEFICKCKQMSTSLSVVNDIVLSCTVLVETVVSKLQTKVLRALSKVGIQADSSEVIQLVHEFDQHKKPFKKMDTAYMQNKYWKDRGLLVEPKEYTVGVRNVYHTDKRTGMNVPRMELSTGQYISIQEMLQSYLKNEDYAKMATSNKQDDGDVLKSYCDGKKWQRERKDNVINLRFYGDDIEPANPIGSHKTLYKIYYLYLLSV